MAKTSFKLDQETLIKHRFWFLLGLFVLLFLLSMIGWHSVASATDAAEKTVNGTLTALTGIKTPKNDSWVQDLEPREKKVQQKKKEIWMNAWNSQAPLFVFPPELSDLKSVPFGKEIGYAVRDRLAQNSDIINRQLEKIAEIVNPVDKEGNGAVQYLNGDAKTVLGMEQTWPDRPTSADIWLELEDLWLKGGLLDVVRDCNDTVGTFENKDGAQIANLQQEMQTIASKRARTEKKLKKDDSDKDQLKKDLAAIDTQSKKFQAQIQAIQQRHKPTSPNEVDRQTFTNRIWQMDLSLENDPSKGALVLKGKLTNRSNRRQLLAGLHFDVTLRDNPSPVRVLADGEPLGPNDSLTMKPVSGIRRGDAIVAVRQVFNWQTVPVKRIDNIYLALYNSSRTAPQTKLAPYAAFKPQTDPNAAPADTGGSQEGGKNSMMANMMNMRKMMGGNVGGNGGAPGPPGMGKGKGGGGAGLITDRYSQQSDAVRRVPVAMKVVIDQAYLQDLLTAVANSRLRIQITQVEWKHFPRGESIEPPHEEEEGPSENTRPTTPRGPSGGGKTLPPGMGGLGGPAPAAGAGTTTKSTGSDEMSANLLEVAVYGVASIYEAYTPSKAKE